MNYLRSDRSGAMGSLFGGRLSLAGHDVVLYDMYREHVEKILATGLPSRTRQRAR